jgi:hypothetical protein
VYKTGWDPDYANLGLGLALGAEGMRWAEAAGVTEFDYLRGRRGHKVDLGCVPAEDVAVLRTGGVAGRVLALREQFSAGGVRPRWISAILTSS